MDEKVAVEILREITEKYNVDYSVRPKCFQCNQKQVEHDSSEIKL